MSKSTPTIQSFVQNPSYTIAAAFVIGAVAIESLRVFSKLCGLGQKWDRFIGGYDQGDNNAMGVLGESGEIDGREPNRHENSNLLRAIQKGIAATILIVSLSALGTLLYYPVGGETGCAFLVGWETIAIHSIKILCFLYLVLGEFKVRRWELWGIYTFLLIRLGITILATSTNSGILLPLPEPFIETTLCAPINYPSLAIAHTILDILFLIYLTTRLTLPSLPSDRQSVRVILRNRFAAQVGSLMILLLTGIAQTKIDPNLAALWIPQSLALLLLLPTFTRPHSLAPRSTLVVDFMPPPSFTINFDDNLQSTKSTPERPKSTSRPPSPPPKEFPTIAGSNVEEVGEVFSRFGAQEQRKVTASTIGYPHV